MSGIYEAGQNVPHFKTDRVKFQMFVVTLRMRSSSNIWYIQKCFVMSDILTPYNRLICKISLQYSHSYSPLVKHWRDDLGPISQRSKVAVT